MSHGRPPALVTTWCKVEKWEADFGEMCDAQTCVRAPATMFSPLFSLVSDNCHGHRATHLVKAIPCCVHGRAGVRPEIPAGFRCCVSENVTAGGLHDEGVSVDAFATPAGDAGAHCTATAILISGLTDVVGSTGHGLCGLAATIDRRTAS